MRQHLLAAGVPGIQAVKERPSPKSRDEGINLDPGDEQPVREPDRRAHQQDGGDRERPRPTLTLQSDRQHLRDPDIEAGGQVKLVRHHRDEDRQRDQKLHRLVAEDRPDVEIGEERVGPQKREHDHQQHEQD